MKNKYKALFGGLAALLLLVIFAGCRPVNFEQVSDEDLQGLKDYVVSSYFILKGDENLADGRATVPVHSNPQPSFAGGTLSDYPEQGQVTTWTVADHATISGVYEVNANTVYDTNDAIDYTEEIYLVKDVADADGVTGTWGVEDPIVNQAGESDPLYRIKFITVFKDGSIRFVEIEHSDWADETYAAFEKPTKADVPAAESDFVTTDTDAFYSSKVAYQQDIYKRFAFWNVLYKTIVGVRYYTETGTDWQDPIRTSITYERTVERSTEEYGRGKGKFIQALKAALFAPDTLDVDNATLAETAIWYEIDLDGNKEIVQKSKIVNDFGDAFYLSAEGGEVSISGTP